MSLYSQQKRFPAQRKCIPYKKTLTRDFIQSFARYSDVLGGDEAWVNVFYTRWSRQTKSILAYLYWKDWCIGMERHCRIPSLWTWMTFCWASTIIFFSLPLSTGIKPYSGWSNTGSYWAASPSFIPCRALVSTLLIWWVNCRVGDGRTICSKRNDDNTRWPKTKLVTNEKNKTG